MLFDNYSWFEERPPATVNVYVTRSGLLLRRTAPDHFRREGEDDQRAGGCATGGLTRASLTIAARLNQPYRNPPHSREDTLS